MVHKLRRANDLAKDRVQQPFGTIEGLRLNCWRWERRRNWNDMKWFQDSILCRIRLFSQGCHVKCGKHPFLSHLKTKSKSGLELSLEQRCRMEVSLPRDKIRKALGNATSPGYLSSLCPSGSIKQHITHRIKKSLSWKWKRSSFWPKILKQSQTLPPNPD